MTARRPHVIYLAIGFPPAAKSCTYRMRETANQFCDLGWDVTVLTIEDAAWEREYGLDYTLNDAVDPRVKVIKLPLVREDLETNIRRYSESRAMQPQRWIKTLRDRGQLVFPEPVFGAWRPELEKAMLKVHRSHPADLVLASCAPYVNLAAVWKLWEAHRVPYAIDFRDGWSVDVINGGSAFDPDSVAGEWETKVLANAIAVWTVNDPIADHYRQRYPDIADRVRVVRNGYDPDSLPEPVTRRPDPARGLTFGYLGSVNFSPVFLDSVLAAWRIARAEDPLVARSRFEVRGHIGAGHAREANGHIDLLSAAANDAVSFHGPVAKADLAATYGSWDVLTLMLVGGRFVTSGKVYEFMASGLPVLSVHVVDHDASALLAGHPLWVEPVGVHPRRLAASFIAAARLAVTATDADRAAARRHGEQYSRAAQLRPAIEALASAVTATEAVPA